MSEREDKKLESVVLARFQYRYEAEFAAGFLEAAGIPYRVQIDDAAMGMTIATPATIWVRGMDLVDARELLETGTPLDGPEPASDSAAEWPGEPEDETEGEGDRGATEGGIGDRGAAGPRAEQGDGEAGRRPGPGAPSGPPRRACEVVVRPEGRAAPTDATRLTALERILALALCVAGIGGATAVSGGPAGLMWAGVLVALALPMGVGAVLGRTISWARGLLRAISGSA